jgi:hypothetical protein
MNEFEILFPIPEARRNADDMGYPSPVQEQMTRSSPVTDEIVERAWAAIVGGDIATTCYNASIIRRDLRTALEAVFTTEAATPRCDRCGSSGDTYVLCSGCGGPLPDVAASPSDGAIYAAVSQRDMTPEERVEMDALFAQAATASTPAQPSPAANRIEALEAALQIIAETANYLGNGTGVVGDLEKIARAALAPEQNK